MGNNSIPIFDPANKENIYFTHFGSDVQEDTLALPYGDDFTELNTNEIDTRYLNELDKLIGTQVALPGKDGFQLMAIVKDKKRNYKGEAIGSYNPNPMLDSRIYELEFPDGRIEEDSVKTIIENLVDQVRTNDCNANLFDEIISTRKDKNIASKKGEEEFTTIKGVRRPIITTKGWSIQIKWNDGSVSWHPLSAVKSSNQIDLAEYAVSNKLSNESAFKWWVNQTLRKRNKLGNKLKNKATNKKIKFGIEVPSTVEEALCLDHSNGD